MIANRSNIQNCNVNGKSFTYRRNSKGPRTDPCGTPAFSAIGIDNFPEMWTCCDLLLIDRPMADIHYENLPMQ